MSSNSDKTNLSDSEIEKIDEELSLISKKWSVKTIKSLMAGKRLSFKELRNRINGVSNKILSERLKQLRKNDIVVKNEDRYSLTKKGQDLRTVFNAVLNWKDKHDS